MIFCVSKIRYKFKGGIYFYLIWPPFAPSITFSNLDLNAFTTAHVFFWEILAHAFCKNFFKWLTECFSEQHVSFSSIDHMLKSSGFRSREEGGHISLSQNERKFSLHHDWVFLRYAMCHATIKFYQIKTLHLFKLSV